MNFNPQNEKIKTKVVLGMLVFAYGLLVLRTWKLHLFNDHRLEKLEGRQAEYKTKLISERGKILDRNGKVLAVSLKVPSFFVDPQKFEPTKSDLKKISILLRVSEFEVQKKILKGTKRFAWIKRLAEPGLESEIEKLKIKGLHYTYEWKRFYPDRELAAQVIGFVGENGHGLEGLEKNFDKKLSGTQITLNAGKDAKGRAIYENSQGIENPKPGQDLRLTIDAHLQHLLEKEMGAAAKLTQVESAFGIIMDPQTGEVLAMASYPFVNPNRPMDHDEKDWRNRPVQEVFEPGSTFKVFVMASALEQKKISPKEGFNCSEDDFRVSGRKIHNSVKKNWLDPKGIIKFSNNVGMVRIGQRVGGESLEKRLRSYGFGEKSDLGFPGETKGLLAPASKWQPMDLATISFGLGIGVTAIQMVSAFSAFSSGGYEVYPKLILDSADVSAPPTVETQKKKIIDERVIKTMLPWLESVVETDGTGSRAKIEGYRVAGKTGTAQMFDPKEKAYSHQLLTSSFMGFAPVEDPKFVSLIVFRKPYKPIHGGELAAPIFRKVISQALSYKGILPSEQKKILFNKSVSRQNGVKFKKENTASSTETLVSLKGMSLREVLEVLGQQKIKVTSVGSGYVYDQEPKAGQPLSALKSVKVFLSNPLERRKT